MGNAQVLDQVEKERQLKINQQSSPLPQLFPFLSNTTRDSHRQDQARLAKLEEEYPAIKLLVHPYRLLIIGASGSGKTTLGVKCIEYLLPQVDEVFICSPTYEFQKTWDPIRSRVTLAHDGSQTVFDALYATIKNSIGFDDHKIGERLETRRLLILDDVSYEKAINQGNKGNFNAFAYNARHWNLSIVAIVHKTSNIGAGMRENCEGLVLFNTVNMNEVGVLYDNYGITKTKKQLISLFDQFIWQKIQKGEDKHPFLFVDLLHGKLVYDKLRTRLQFE